MSTDPHDKLLDRSGLEILSTDECWELLASSAVGRVGFVDAGQPLVMPVNHGVVGRHIVFLTSRGAKFSAAIMQRPVAFEVDQWDAASHTGWSVLVEGVADVVSESEELEELDALGLQPWTRPSEKTNWIRILTESVSGRRVPRD